MLDWSKDFCRWVLAVLRKWYGWLPSSAVAAGIGYGQGFGWWHPGTKTYASILAIGGVVSLFEAWREQFRKAGTRKPDFTVEVIQVICKLQMNRTLVLLSLRIRNNGAPSAVFDFGVQYKAYDSSGMASNVMFSDAELHFDFPETKTYLVFKPTDALNFKFLEPIPTGGFIAGRIPVLVPGDQVKAVASGDCELKVIITDYLNNPHSAAYKGGKPASPVYLMGESIAPGQIGERRFDQKAIKSAGVYRPPKGKKKH